jgi:hypothetical protein
MCLQIFRDHFVLVPPPMLAVCTGSPEAPAGGAFDCGNSSAPGTVCNGTCSTGEGSITAECQSTGNWTVQGTCTLLQTGGETRGVPLREPYRSKMPVMHV